MTFAIFSAENDRLLFYTRSLKLGGTSENFKGNYVGRFIVIDHRCLL